MLKERPIPKIRDIKGEISIAPIITVVELVSKPIEAKAAEQNNNQIL